MKSYWFLFWACAVIWGFLAAFLILMLARQNRAERKLRTIEGRVAHAEDRRSQESSDS